MKYALTRRHFLRGAAAAVLGTAVGFPQESSVPQNKSRVILIRHKDALDENSQFNEKVIQQMLDDAVTKLLDQNDPVAAFRHLVKPEDIVGIKSNVWSYLPTPPEVEKAIKRRLLDAGVKEEAIAIDDHTVRTNPIFVKSTALINARPLRTHYLAGMSGCIKNYIMFDVSQPAHHPDSCASLGSLFLLPQVKGKTRLNVLCVLTPQYYGRGPHNFNRRYVWNYKGLIVGQDVVAVDTIGLRLLMAKRRKELGPAQEIPPVPKHIQLADTKYGIGTSDINKIELIKLGWPDEILI
ncbi:MAG: twin-arginine translocation signal domain-containing protein [Candidatus Aminicenantes bacterium]|nr:twin-arginine translocation signal domain-containing protein [Candidatus Aminicenantes bacterium]